MARILIVEDEQLVALDLQEALISLGHTVMGMVASGDAAIQLAEQTRPDVVLMDIRLDGEMDGVAATQEIYQRYRIPVIYLTASTDESTLRRALTTYPFGYLSKPWQEASLHNSIEVALQRSQWERTLWAQSRHLAQTIDSIADAAIVTDYSGNITHINPTAEVLTGWQREKAIGLPIEQVMQFIHAETREPIGNPLLQAIRQSQSVRLPDACLLLTKDGSEVPVGDSAAPIYNDIGEIQGSIAVIQQITPQQEAQQGLLDQLREQTTQLQQAIACMQGFRHILAQAKEQPDQHALLQMIITEIGMTLAADYCWLSLRTTGYATTTVTADYIGECHTGPTLPLNTQLDGDSVISYYEHLETVGFWLAPSIDQLPSLYQPIVPNPSLVLICPLRDDHQIIGDIGIRLMNSWTALGAEVVAQLIRQCSLVLQQSSNHPSEPANDTDTDLTAISISFINALSTQLQTPMTNIRMVAEVMRQIMTSLRELDDSDSATRAERQALWQKMEQYLEILHNEWQQESYLLNDLLSIQVAVIPRDMPLAPLDLQAWLPTIVEPIVRQAMRRQHTLHYQVVMNTPTITIHTASLERIITELLNNACKHSPIGQHITLIARVVDQQLELRVTNTGVEIPAREMRQIFEPFYRIKRPGSRDSGSLGLGLALIKKLVMHLEGDIKVASPRPNETSFVVILPLQISQLEFPE